MKKTTLTGLAALLALCCISCSSEEPSESKPEKVSLSFSAVLTNFDEGSSGLKQMTKFPACSDDWPAYCSLVLSQDGVARVGSMDEPFLVNLNSAGFTVEVPELQLDQGTYSLDFFCVHSQDGTPLWIAPSDGVFGDYMDPLPNDLNLGNGTAKYQDVPVVCFDDRMVNEYGYLFFDIEQQELLEFCVFGNYCDEGGRHFPAAFELSVWEVANGEMGDLFHEAVANEVVLNEDGDYAGSTLCLALPDSPGEDEYYMEIRLLNSGAYGEVAEEVIRSGIISDEDVRSLFDGENEIEFFHFRAGCENVDEPQLFGEPAPM